MDRLLFHAHDLINMSVVGSGEVTRILVEDYARGSCPDGLIEVRILDFLEKNLYVTDWFWH